MELLSAETRVDGHYKDEVDLIQISVEVMYVRRGVHGDAGLQSQVVYLVHRGHYISLGLRVDGDGVASGLGEILYVSDGVLDHQMGVEWDVRPVSGTFDDRCSECKVGDEHAVHDVQMCPVGSALFYPYDLFA